MISKSILVFSMAALLGAATPLHAAESCEKFEFIYQKTFYLGDGEGMEKFSCNEKNLTVGDKLYGKLQELMKAGKYTQASNELDDAFRKNDVENSNDFKPDIEVCVRPGLQKDFTSLMHLLGQKLAAQAEQAKNYEEAITINSFYCHRQDNGPVYLHYVKSKPFDLDLHKQAVAYAENIQLPSVLTELKQIAATNLDKFIAQDDKMYKAHGYSTEPLSDALVWADYLKDNAKQASIKSIAEKHGDSLAAMEGCTLSTPALNYYELAGKSDKIKQYKARTLKLGEQYEKQGGLSAAEKCYDAAGARDKANKVADKDQEQRDAKEAALKKAEPARQKKFNKETEDLEKELGL